MDAKTQQDIGIEMLYIGEIKGVDDYEFEFPSMVQKKKNYQWPLTKNENNRATSNQCAISQIKSSEP